MYIDETNAESQLVYDTIDEEECPGKACKTEYLHSSPLCEDSIAVLKCDPDFIRSILVSVRLGRCQQPGNGLTPIPEGKVDSIPRPVWPNDDPSSDRARPASRPPTKSRTRNRHNHPPQHRSRRHSAVGAENGAAPIKVKHRANVGRPLLADSAAAAALLPPALSHILRQLSHNINDAMENADRVEIPPDAVLRSLRTKINSCLEAVSAKEAAAYAADTVADLYERGSGDSGCVTGDRSVVATLSRAFSFVNAFHKDGSHRRNDGTDTGGGDEDDDIERGRLMLLKRLGRFPPPVSSNARTAADPCYERLPPSSSGSASGSGSSSSCASTSGFSDLTHTPVSSNSSASDSPPACRSVAENGGHAKTTAAVAASTAKSGAKCHQRHSESGSSGIGCEGSGGGGVGPIPQHGGNEVKAVGPSFASSFPYHAIPHQTTVSGDVPSRRGSTCDIVADRVGSLARATSVHLTTDTLLSVSTYLVTYSPPYRLALYRSSFS